jgi:fructuronate reductase
MSASTTPRLHPDRLAGLPRDVERPRYDRGALRPGIVHLGIGAFARAHLAVATEAALHAGEDLAWAVTGVSLRSPSTRDALAPQRGLYSVALREASADGKSRESLQVVGALLDVLVARASPQAVLERIAHPGTRIVSLTVTEKGYCHDPATGTLLESHPDIVHDLAHADVPRSALGLLVRGLALRRARGAGPLTLLSLDNLPGNGNLLRRLVLDFAHAADPPTGDWVAAHCTFPNSMVDRIVPQTTDADRAHIAARLGLSDAWPVVSEPYFDWVVEDRFAGGRPDWSAGGARFVSDAAPWERRKLRMVNGAHSALAYLSVDAGWSHVDVAIAQPAMRNYVDRLLREEVEPTLPPLPGIEAGGYLVRLLQRLANAALQHRTRQIAMDGSQKLPQRLLETVRERLAAGAPIRLLALGIAGWLHHLRGVDESGARFVIDDPLAPPLLALRAQAATLPTALERARALCGYAPVFGDLASHPLLVAAVAEHLETLETAGVRAALAALG